MLHFVVFFTYLANFVCAHHIPEHAGMAQDFVRTKIDPKYIDPRSRPTVTAGSDHYFCTCCLSVRPSPLFKISNNKTKFKRK